MKKFAESRILSAIELLVGSFIVIGHNVFHVVPNEVPILFVLGLISVRLRNGSWSRMGLIRPASWLRVIQIALIAASLRIILGDFVIEPIANHFWPAIKAPEGSEQIAGNVKTALLYFALVWTFAAFGEEISYRGYLLTRAADLGNRSTPAYWIAVLVVSILFGFGHYYKGPTGVLDSGLAGLILGAAFMISGRNLWTTILAHGFIDTFGIVALFFGWQKT